MSSLPSHSTLTRLRSEFDDAFARPHEAEPDRESFLGIGLRGDSYALRVADIESVFTDRTVIPFPTSVHAFRGLTAHRGALVPVYDLGVLLGYPLAATPRWLATVRAPTARIGLAFDRFDGHYRIVASPSSRQPGLLQVVTGLEGRSVIDVPSILDSLLQRKGALNS